MMTTISMMIMNKRIILIMTTPIITIMITIMTMTMVINDNDDYNGQHDCALMVFSRAR